METEKSSGKCLESPICEEWRPIEGYEDFYEISNLGRVRSHGSIRSVKPWNNYCVAKLYRNGNCKTAYVHRLVAKAFIPNPQNKHFVNHKDGDKRNNHADNLEWCTRQENEIHAWRIGLKTVSPNHPAGEKHGMHKLSADDVAYIRSHHVPFDATYGSAPLAKKFNVRPQTITDIAHYRTWKGVEN